MNIDVYYGEHADIKWMYDELVKFDKFMANTRNLFPDHRYAMDFLETSIEKQFVIVTKGRPLDDPDQDWIRTGFIVGFLWPNHLNPEIMVLSEVFWWVTDEYRGGRSGLLLLNEFIAFGKEKADQITVTLQEESKVNDRILTKKGFRARERSFTLEV